MARRILDDRLMSKLAERLRKKPTAISVMVSKEAAKRHISSQAALVVLAKEHGIGTAAFQRKLDAPTKQEIRDTLTASVTLRKEPAKRANGRTRKGGRAAYSDKRTFRMAIDLLIQDPVLRERCRDLLLANASFDRPINQATQVLEDRIRKKAQPERPMTGETLVGYYFKEGIRETKIQVASGDPDDQRGITQILRGIVPAFRNITHHHIVDRFSRQDAMRICGFIDLLLRVVDSSKKLD